MTKDWLLKEFLTESAHLFSKSWHIFFFAPETTENDEYRKGNKNRQQLLRREVLIKISKEPSNLKAAAQYRSKLERRPLS